MNKKIVVITHKNCPDGFVSAWVAWTIFKDNANYIGENPGQNALPYSNSLKNKEVYIFDISFPSKFINYLKSITSKLIMIDHHPDSDYLQKEFNNKNFIFDKNYSAAYLSWKFFYPNEKVPIFIKLVSDNDTGTWKMKYSKQLSHCIKHKIKPELNNSNFNKVSKLKEKSYLKACIMIGKIYTDYEDDLTKSIIKMATRKKWNNYNIMIANANIPKLGGMFANKFIELSNTDIGIVYRYLNKNLILYTMRSNNKNIDLNKIAGEYGGGGHVGAASFKSSENNIFE